MRKYLRILLTYGLSLASLTAGAAGTTGDRLGIHQREKNFIPWDSKDLQQAEKLFGAMFSGDFSESVTSAWRNLGMTLTPVAINKEENGYKLAPTPPREGAGYYLFRASSTSPIVLQAPHQFHDRNTGRIARLWFIEHAATALALNSAHRFRVANRSSTTVNADLAHNAASPMMAFTRAFATAFSQGKIVQIHGFARGKRTNRFNQRASVIVSGGTRWVTPASATVAHCLSPKIPGVLLFPKDINELGGTTNSMANWLGLIGHKGFIHMEIDAINRENLLNKRQLRDDFWSCL